MNHTLERIAVLDEKLKILRLAWLDDKREKEGHWLGKINKALDERLVFMGILKEK